MQQPDRLDAVVAGLQQRLDQTIREIAGPAGLAAVVKIRELAQAAHAGRAEALSELARSLAALSADERRVVARALSIFLDLMNVAEDRQRVRVLREAQRATHPRRAESIRAAVAQLAAEAFTVDELQQLLDRLDIELVLTAPSNGGQTTLDPRQAAAIAELLRRCDERELLPREAAELDAQLQAELTKLWQTDFIRPWPPTVIQEVQRGLSIMPVLWDVVPGIVRDLRQALAEFYPGHALRVTPLLRFASWVGGDRDGHPGVTADVTEQTLVWLRTAAVAQQRDTVCQLFGSLSLSSRQAPVSEELRQALAGAIDRWPELERLLEGIPPNETYRRWLLIVDWRLQQSRQTRPSAPPPAGAYESSDILAEDVRIMQRSLSVLTTMCWLREKSSAGWIKSRSSACTWPGWMSDKTPVTTSRSWPSCWPRPDWSGISWHCPRRIASDACWKRSANLSPGRRLRCRTRREKHWR